jgi:hypothetical protein
MDGHIDAAAVPGQSFIDAVVDDFIDKVVQAGHIIRKASFTGVIIPNFYTFCKAKSPCFQYVLSAPYTDAGFRKISHPIKTADAALLLIDIAGSDPGMDYLAITEKLRERHI